jgi:hypothetical protein
VGNNGLDVVKVVEKPQEDIIVLYTSTSETPWDGGKRRFEG